MTDSRINGEARKFPFDEIESRAPGSFTPEWGEFYEISNANKVCSLPANQLQYIRQQLNLAQ